MEVYKGTAGLGQSWQNNFEPPTKCSCGGEARIAFVAIEKYARHSKGPRFIQNLHKNELEKGLFWRQVC